MSKPNATCAVLGTLVLCCLPVVAATISSDDLRILLGGSAKLVGPHHYQVEAGSTAVLGIQARPGEMVWCIVVAEDMWGEPDYSNMLVVPFARSDDGFYLAFVDVPAELAGSNFHIQAVAMNAKGDLRGSEELTVTIPGAQVLFPAPRRNAGMAPALN